MIDDKDNIEGISKMLHNYNKVTEKKDIVDKAVSDKTSCCDCCDCCEVIDCCECFDGIECFDCCDLS